MNNTLNSEQLSTVYQKAWILGAWRIYIRKPITIGYKVKEKKSMLCPSCRREAIMVVSQYVKNKGGHSYNTFFNSLCQDIRKIYTLRSSDMPLYK